MQKTIKYTVFKTKWGYFGFAGTQTALLRTCLPLAEPDMVKRSLLPGFNAPEYQKNLFITTQKRIAAYFDGACVTFGPDSPIAVDGLSQFAAAALAACRKIDFGKTATYAQLAKKIGRPNAARAVGSVMARNPLPLIIPCHRVIRADGKIGGFSAPAGPELKIRLLRHEHRILNNSWDK